MRLGLLPEASLLQVSARDQLPVFKGRNCEWVLATKEL
jgi:hypothetical protein